MIIIRTIEEKDYEGIHKLFKEIQKLHAKNCPDIFKNADPFTEEDFEHYLYDENILVYVAEENKKIIGFTTVVLDEPVDNPIVQPRNVAYMEVLCVDKKHRNQGVGKDLFSEVCDAAKKRGADVVELMVWSFNKEAIDFYKSLGLVERNITMNMQL